MNAYFKHLIGGMVVGLFGLIIPVEIVLGSFWSGMAFGLLKEVGDMTGITYRLPFNTGWLGGRSEEFDPMDWVLTGLGGLFTGILLWILGWDSCFRDSKYLSDAILCMFGI